MKKFIELSTVQNKGCVLYIEDHQLVHSEFLELINSFISSGEIPGLYSQEEVDHLFSGNNEEIRQENIGKTLYEAFCLRASKNLRVILSLDHMHEKFNNNCASNPAIYTKCDIIWMDSWSKESMNEIISQELKETLKDLPSNVREEIFQYFIAVHRSAASKGASPRHLFSLTETYKKIYEGKVRNSLYF